MVGLACCHPALPCGYCLEASMTGQSWCCLSVMPSPLIPLPSRRPLQNCLFQDSDGFEGLFSASKGFRSVWKRPPDAFSGGASFQSPPRALGRAQLRFHACCLCRSRTSARRRLYAMSLNSISVSFRASPS